VTTARHVGEEVTAMGRRMGFALAGITPAKPSHRAREFTEWLADGKHGEMAWLARNVEERLDPSHALPGARSIIMVADVYARDAEAESVKPRDGSGRIARYARGDDYHRVMKQRLHAFCDVLRERYPADAFRAFVDTAPVMEREHALRAGLGWIGKHTLLIHPRLGSFFFLGGVLTTLELESPEEQRPIADHCGTCTRCIDACPTHAITPYSVDARRCISYLTIEHRGPIAPEFHAPIGDWLFGCDICQEVCPHNRERPLNRDRQGAGSDGARSASERETAPSAHPAYVSSRASFDLLEVLGWTEEDRRHALARSALKRANLAMWKRNALIAAGNVLRSGNAATLRDRIGEIARDEQESAMVLETARSVLEESVKPTG
jgi:epoxyqueuosine reductase